MSDNKPLSEAPNTQNVSSGPSTSSAEPAPKAKPRNPAFVAMGLPRLRLPSRNWMIFLSIVGTWTAYVQYDRREKRIALAKWQRLVTDLKNDTLPTTALQRKLTIVLAAPPADGIIVAREHFHEYVKPVLEESGLDWDAVEGRREGDVRAGIAERVRKIRRKAGEKAESWQLEDWEILLDDIRQKMGAHALEGVAGDLVIGRHAWKEYVRGLHEGWLGPMDPPKAEEESKMSALQELTAGELAADSPSLPPPTPLISDDPLMLTNTENSADASPTSILDSGESAEKPAEPAEPEKTEEQQAEEEARKKKKKQPPPFLQTSDYHNASLSSNCPDILGPSDPIPMPHLLGFLNFPIRIYRYLHKRDLAETIGRQTAAAALAVYRPYETIDSDFNGSQDAFFAASPSPQLEYASGGADTKPDSGDAHSGDEIKDPLQQEETEWHKTIRNREAPPEQGKEYTWTDGMVLDQRITQRMRRFILSREEEERAKTIDAQIRREKWDKTMDIPARLWRGVGATFGKAPAGRSPLETVGDVSDLD